MRASVKTSVLILLLAGFFGSVSSTLAQPFAIFGYTNQFWKYTTNNMDGTGWQGTSYDDSDMGIWSTNARASIGYEDTAATLTSLNTAGATINTFVPQPASGGRYTLYFRTHFNFSGTPGPGVSLIFSNRIDDGAVVYLNGSELYRLGIASTVSPVTYTTLSADSEATNLRTVTTNNPPGLVTGDNVIAVEVHNTGNTSSDLVLALALSGATAFPPSINYASSSLTNRTVKQCVQPTTFSVSASGFPVPTYQWFHNGGSIPNATDANYTIAGAGPGDAGTYSVTVSNDQGVVTSTPNAVLSVIADTTPPDLLFSYVDTNLTNIVLVFDEPVIQNPDITSNSYVVDTNDTAQVEIAGVTYLTNTTVLLHFAAPLNPAHGYEINLSFVQDACGTNTLPDRAYPVGRLVEHVIGFTNSTWKYDINNGDRFGTGWETLAYDDSAWPSGIGGLGHESDLQSTNFAVFGIPGTNAIPIYTHLNYSSNSVPSFFRTHFTLPATSTNFAGLIIRDVIEDGGVYYINGQEVLRHNVGSGPLSMTTRAPSGQTDPTPIKGPFYLPPTGLKTGDNVLAVALFQNGATSSDMELAVDLSVVVAQPSAPPPTLFISYSGGNVTVTWSGGGTLQGSTDLNSPSNWMNIAGATSPYTAPASGPYKFFRVTVP